MLLEYAAFADFLVERIPVMEKEWKAHREALHAAGEFPDGGATGSAGTRP